MKCDASPQIHIVLLQAALSSQSDFKFFHQMKMSESEPFSKGSLSIEINSMVNRLFLCEK
jgi:hypothetical protein